MQNAAIIRYHAEYILTSTSGLKIFTDADINYVQLMRNEVLRFRTLFNDWVMEIQDFEQEEYEDEWGLFVREK